ncbi:RNA polymerase sigma-70 factor (ECF subfamily) [Nocardia sp. GAS34]|uniref:RNA polymerase subunit sigma-70 n=1 Tax=unclassified Nocardia TaxID=2637762 RepID=UPI003D1CF1EA
MRPMISGTIDRNEFLRTADRYRPELIAHCYRMVGSVHEAEDLVQETYLRAWRGWESFEQRSTERAWLYRIATNLCLTAVAHQQRRVLPSGIGPTSADPDSPFATGTSDPLWIELFPNRLYETAGDDPAEIAVSRSTLRLALIASLQHLPPRQRAVFILREVLSYPAAEVADILGTTVAAVKSALQRARATLDELAPVDDAVPEPDSPQARAVLDRYMAAFENADIPALTELLRDDAILESVPLGTSLAGKDRCIARLAQVIGTTAGRYRMHPTIVNGQPTAVAYRREHPDSPFTLFAVVVLAVDAHQVTRITSYQDPAMINRFDLVGQRHD